MTAGFDGIVAGIDTPELSHALLDWAVDTARARRVPVRIVHALDPAAFDEPARLAGGYTWPPVPLEEVRSRAEEALRHAQRYLASIAPEIAVSTELHQGSPVATLLQTARPRDLVAIGSRHLGAVRSALFGSTGMGLVRASHRPFVVVRGERATVAQPPVVVGVDPTEGTEAVLAAAFEHAAAHDLPLRALLCWEPYLHFTLDGTSEPRRAAHADAEVWLSEALAGWEESCPGVKVERSLLFEHPSVALTRASVGSALVVVGVGGTHVPRGIGSVAAGVLHHAACPVMVVPR